MPPVRRNPMAPSARWTQEKTESLLNAFGKTFTKTATVEQKQSIEARMKENGYECSWEGVRYVIVLHVSLSTFNS